MRLITLALITVLVSGCANEYARTPTSDGGRDDNPPALPEIVTIVIRDCVGGCGDEVFATPADGPVNPFDAH